MPAPEPDLLRDFGLAEAAAREAGTLALAHFSAGPKAWNKDDNSPVSEADHAVDRLLRDRLTAARPGYGWLSEETPDSTDRLSRSHVWVIDPIDGTRAFLKQRGDWVVSLALVRDGVPVIGAVYNPVHEEMFTALIGGGAALNGTPIQVGDRVELDRMTVLANPSRFAPKRWRRPWPDIAVTQQNAIAYRLAQVAAGRFDAAVAFARVHEWDLAAADIILAEAGGTLSDSGGHRLAYNKENPVTDGAIGANTALVERIAAFIADNRPHETDG